MRSLGIFFATTVGVTAGAADGVGDVAVADGRGSSAGFDVGFVVTGGVTARRADAGASTAFEADTTEDAAAGGSDRSSAARGGNAGTPIAVAALVA